MKTDYEHLIALFEQLPQIETRQRSFISICGFPHYERVASNILAFFFDTTREHKFGNLFVKSLLETLQIKTDNISLNHKSITEQRTDTGRFIDILLVDSDSSIVIENKIFANLYNELNDYYEFSKIKINANTYGVVLSLNPIKSENTEYRFTTYEELFKTIRCNLGFYIEKANSKYLPFLFDFFDNIENLTRKNSMDEKFITFVKVNGELIGKLENALNQFRIELRTSVDLLNGALDRMLKDEKVIDKYELWHWKEKSNDLYDIAVLDFFPMKDLNLAIDSKYDSDGWSFSVFIRKKSPEIDYSVETIEHKLQLAGKKDSRFFSEKEFSYGENIETVAKFVFDMIKKLRTV